MSVVHAAHYAISAIMGDGTAIAWPCWPLWQALWRFLHHPVHNQSTAWCAAAAERAHTPGPGAAAERGAVHCSAYRHLLHGVPRLPL